MGWWATIGGQVSPHKLFGRGWGAADGETRTRCLGRTAAAGKCKSRFTAQKEWDPVHNPDHLLMKLSFRETKTWHSNTMSILLLQLNSCYWSFDRLSKNIVPEVIREWNSKGKFCPGMAQIIFHWMLWAKDNPKQTFCQQSTCIWLKMPVALDSRLIYRLLSAQQPNIHHRETCRSVKAWKLWRFLRLFTCMQIFRGLQKLWFIFSSLLFLQTINTCFCDFLLTRNSLNGSI